MTKRFFSFLAVTAMLTSQAQAEITPELANKVLTVVSAMAPPSAAHTQFYTWSYDTAVFSALGCWRAANPTAQKNDLPEFLKTARARRLGSFKRASIKEEEGLCQSIAQLGVQPVCTNVIITTPARVNPGLPIDFIQFPAVTRTPQVEGGLHCYLNSRQVARQFYVGPLVAQWTQTPTPKLFNNAMATKQPYEVGTVQITAPGAVNTDGKPFVQSFTGVIPITPEKPPITIRLDDEEVK